MNEIEQLKAALCTAEAERDNRESAFQCSENARQGWAAQAIALKSERDTAHAEVRALQLKLEAVHTLYLGATADNVASALEIARLTKDRDLNRNTRLHDGEVAKQWAKDRDDARAEVARLKESRESFVRQLAASESALAAATARCEALEGVLRFYADINNFQVTVWANETHEGECWTEPARDHGLTEAGNADFGIRADEILDTRDTVTPAPEEKP